MTVPKRKVSVYLDADLVHELDAADETRSQQVSDAVREFLLRRRRQRMLNQLLDEMSARDGPVPADLIDKYAELLG